MVMPCSLSSRQQKQICFSHSPPCSAAGWAFSRRGFFAPFFLAPQGSCAAGCCAPYGNTPAAASKRPLLQHRLCLPSLIARSPIAVRHATPFCSIHQPPAAASKHPLKGRQGVCAPMGGRIWNPPLRHPMNFAASRKTRCRPPVVIARSAATTQSKDLSCGIAFSSLPL